MKIHIALSQLISSKKPFISIFLLLICPLIYSQSITGGDFIGIKGLWEGTLTYVDYGDDQTQYSLNTRLEATWKNGSGKLKFEFKEPNGKLVYSTERIKFIDSKTFFFNKKWEIVGFEKNGDSWTMTLESKGKDNNRESTLREEINYENGKLFIRKMVMYKGTDSFFMRNSYQLTKSPTND